MDFNHINENKGLDPYDIADDIYKNTDEYMQDLDDIDYDI